MELIHVLTLFCALNTFHSLVSPASAFEEQTSNLETYIVHVELPESETLLSTSSSSQFPNKVLESWYNSFLPTTTESSNDAPHRMVYPYHHVFTGFAAKLSAEDVKQMENKPGFLSAEPQKVLSLHTTHSPGFLGLHRNMGFWEKSNYGKGVIIGVIDSGITADHPSFDDQGMPPPPGFWKGKCEFNASMCNNKLIGVKIFNQGDGIGNASPADEIGHGTHTASTAAGNFVKGANLFGNANGTAAGVAPLAHLAMYKACGSTGCHESDVLAAMDAAIDDGVDILSISLGGRLSEPFYANGIALGAYSAMEKRIFVSCSAGNSGPISSSLANEAPWILTVGASTIDRKIRATVVLGNNAQLDGETVYQPKDFPTTLFPILRFLGKERFFGRTIDRCLEKRDMKGKIVVCEAGEIRRKARRIKANGGVGMIIVNTEKYGYTTPVGAIHILPTVHLNYADRVKLLQYINSTSSPMAAISFKGTLIGDNHAPAVTFFSSRGPSQASPGILKPDIIGPGLNILAAWNVSLENNNNTRSNFNILSGTSMSCPHLSGVAALLKSAHPDWSPAAIKSAMMTTADPINQAKNPIEDERLIPADLFATGTGHVNPAGANNPGLIYDIEPKDYIPYLCGLKYESKQVSLILKHKVDCKKISWIAEAQLNYPSFSITIGSKEVLKYTRTVTNVGEAGSVYNVKVVPLAGVNVAVNPNTLNFTQVNQKLTYEVTFSRSAAPSAASNITMSQGSLTWTSSKYSVRSPIAAILV
ncbi:hypothetical protein ACH5RR_032793 [Cinchona calisaya]|uniref:Uncharacterized protein n=1 Tax=Cinchona calisaya TaxID=153742 RepID=A0ABD2YJ63_9GENT